jgi:2-iminobutanoate/2-iminopropanoate deaminase
MIIPGVASNTGAYSPGIRVGRQVFVSGQGPLKRGTTEIVGTTIEEQTRHTLENIKAILEAADCTMDDCVKVTAYLKRMADFDRYNTVYKTFFNDPLPTRTTVQAELWGGILVEIDAIAIKGSGQIHE